jgi:hypothetical protein
MAERLRVGGVGYLGVVRSGLRRPAGQGQAASIGGQLPQLAARAAMDYPVVAASFVVLTETLLATMDSSAT